MHSEESKFPSCCLIASRFLGVVLQHSHARYSRGLWRMNGLLGIAFSRPNKREARSHAMQREGRLNVMQETLACMNEHFAQDSQEMRR
jgi:hypothetical protein